MLKQITGFPFGLENLETSHGKGQGILTGLEKSHKMLEKLGNFRQLIFFFGDNLSVYYILKWIKCSAKKYKTLKK